MTTASNNARAQFSIRRSYPATVEEAWSLWTTKQGLESWWGPEGFDVSVNSIDLRPGGLLVYTLTAKAPQQVGFMRQAGLPLSTECHATYIEISKPFLLVYKTLADFVPNVEPYEVVTRVTLEATTEGVNVTVTFDAMHNDVWTERARAGNESQLRKLDVLLTTSPKEPS